MKIKNKNYKDKEVMFNFPYKINLDEESFKQRISKLEFKVNTSPHKTIDIDRNNNNNDMKLQLNKTWNPQSAMYNDHFNSVNMMEIKLNHNILENKIEKIRQIIFEENKNKKPKNNYNTNHNEFNSLQVMNPKTDDRRYLRDFNYQNNLDWSSNDRLNLNKDKDNFHTKDDNFNFPNQLINFNSAQSSENWKNKLFKDKTNTNDFKEDGVDIKHNLNNNINYNNHIINDFPRMNGIKTNYKNKDLAELNNKIELSKNRLIECIKKTETFIIDKRIEKNAYYNKITDNHPMKIQNNRINEYIRFIQKSGISFSLF